MNMTIAQQKTIYRLYQKGYKIFIKNILVNRVYFIVDWEDEKHYVYDSDGAAVREFPLSYINENDVRVYEEIDWFVFSVK